MLITGRMSVNQLANPDQKPKTKSLWTTEASWALLPMGGLLCTGSTAFSLNTTTTTTIIVIIIKSNVFNHPVPSGSVLVRASSAVVYIVTSFAPVMMSSIQFCMTVFLKFSFFMNYDNNNQVETMKWYCDNATAFIYLSHTYVSDGLQCCNFVCITSWFNFFLLPALWFLI